MGLRIPGLVNILDSGHRQDADFRVEGSRSAEKEKEKEKARVLERTLQGEESGSSAGVVGLDVKVDVETSGSCIA